MRKLLLAALACVAMPAHATLIQIDYLGSINEDILSASIVLMPHLQLSDITIDQESGCIDTVSTTFDVLSASIKMNGEEIGSSYSTGYYSGSVPRTCGAFFGGLGLRHGDGTRFNFLMDINGPHVADAIFSAENPLLEILQSNAFTWQFVLDSGGGTEISRSVMQVPEPGTLGLLGLGLLATIAMRRRVKS